jgi:hypothetical protein
MKLISHGNAADRGRESRGWFVGHFVDGPASPPERTHDVEVKWGNHSAGQARGAWAKSRTATTLLVLLHGRFHVLIEDNEFVLKRPGDYALWGPDLAHTWRAEDQSIVLTVRWPSSPQDDIEVEPPSVPNKARR